MPCRCPVLPCKLLPVLAAAVLAGAAQAAPLACLIQPSKWVEVGSPVVGVIDSLMVERGDVVKAGQTLLRLRGDVERAAVQVAQTKSNAQAELEAARASHEFAQRKLERSIDLVAQNFLSPQAVDQARSEAQVAEQRLVAAREQQRLSASELDVARTQLGQRVIRSPLAGVVTETYLQPGARVEQSPILRLAQLQPLHVELIMPIQHLGQIKEGEKLEVQPEVQGQPLTVATVKQVDKVLDVASRTFRVRLELPNPQMAIPAGVRCTLVGGAAGSAAAAARALPAAAPGLPAAVPRPLAPRPPTLPAAPTAAPAAGTQRPAAVRPALPGNGRLGDAASLLNL